jgi:hypothetical protein
VVGGEQGDGIPMICSSLNRLPFFRPSPLRDGLYFNSRVF